MGKKYTHEIEGYKFLPEEGLLTAKQATNRSKASNGDTMARGEVVGIMQDIRRNSTHGLTSVYYNRTYSIDKDTTKILEKLGFTVSCKEKSVEPFFDPIPGVASTVLFANTIEWIWLISWEIDDEWTYWVRCNENYNR